MQYSLVIKKFNYEENKEEIFNNLSLKLESGSINFILNDFKKSTLLFNLLFNLIDSPVKATLFNEKVLSSFEEIGYYSPYSDIYKDITIKEFLTLSNSYYQNDYYENAVKLANKFGLDLSKKINMLDKESYEILKLIESMYHDPSLVVLDNPYIYLSKENIDKLNECLNELKKQNSTILISSPDFNKIYNNIDKIYLYYLNKLVSSKDLKIKKYTVTLDGVINDFKLKLLTKECDESVTTITFLGPLEILLDEFLKKNIKIIDIKVGE